MGAIRAGGIASGLDTNTIIDSLVSSAKIPITALENQSYLIGVEKLVYKDMNATLTSLKNATFTLRMESTFKSKMITSTDKNIASATVKSSAQTGTHSINVLQLAKNAQAKSKFTSAVLHTFGAGVTSLDSSTGKFDLYNQQEGSYHIGVKENPNFPGVYVAESAFLQNEGKNYLAEKTTVIINNTFMDKYGKIIAAPSTETMDFKIVIPGGTDITLPQMSFDIGAGDIEDINHLYGEIDERINTEINNALGTTQEQYVTFRAIYDKTTENWSTAIYYTSDYNISLKSTGASVLETSLGLDQPTATSVEPGIVKYVVASSMTDLESKLSDTQTSIISGIGIKTSTALAEGSFEIYQDATLIPRKATKAAVVGSPITINPPPAGQTETNQKMSLTGLIGGDELDGTVTINGTKITLTNTKDKSINDLLAIINGSNAGVKAYIDNGNRVIIESKESGSVSISVGGSGDSSAFLKVFNLRQTDGAINVTGKTNGSVDSSTPLKNAGFASSMTGIFTINNTPIYLDYELDSIDDIIKKVNNSAAGVTLKYDEKSDKFIMTSDTVDQIQVGSASDTSTFLRIANLTPFSKAANYIGTEGQLGVLEVDGIKYYKDSNKIDDIIPGVEFNITSVGVTTLEISADTQTGLNALASFIQTYNTLIEKMTPDTIARKERTDKMNALTEEKKKTMTDDDIAAYNSEFDRLHTIDLKNKSSELRALKKSLRNNIMSPVDKGASNIKSMTEFGLNIAGAGNFEVSKLGYLVTTSTDLEKIKEELSANGTLMTALSAQSDDLYDFFGNYREDVDADGNPTPLYKDSWARRYEKMIGEYQDIQGAIGYKVSTNSPLDKKLQSIAKNIETKTARAEAYLERLWKEFSAMEERVANINSQSQYITQLGGNNASK